MGFFLWYFTKGLRDYFEIWKNLVRFFFRFFSVWPLLITLFSSWHKDLSPHDWRGFRPIKTAQKLVVNLILRFFGAVVRLAVISTGILLTLLATAFGVIMLIVWLLFPLVFLLSLFELILENNAEALSYVVLLLLFVLVVVRAYIGSKRISYEKMTMRQLSKYPIFDRILARIDMTRSDVAGELLDDFEKFKKFLKSNEISAMEFDTILKWEISFQEKKELERKFWRKQYLDQFIPIGKHWKYGYTITLDTHATDLTRFDPTEYRSVQLIGYKEELDMVKLIMQRENQNNVLLIGDPGIGKRSVIHYIAKLIHLGQIDKKLQDKRVMSIDLGRAVSSVVDQGGDSEHALHSLFQEAAYSGNIILAVDDIANYLDPAEGSAVNVASSLDRYLSLPTFQMITTATKSEYHNLIEKHENILKNFDVIEIEEPNDEETVAILMQKFGKKERSRVIFTFQALREIVKKSAQLGKMDPLPERAIDLASETFLYWKKHTKRREEKRIVAEDVAKVMSIRTGVPHGEIKSEERDKLLNMEEIMHRRVIGQDGAIIQLSNAIRKMRAGIGSDEKPVGSFLFLGPTGVGKTETAKTLAQVYFGDEERMIRFDMSEYQNPESIENLIGSRKSGKSGILISKIKDNPFSLILFDEIEKAYPKVLDLFLQVLDEGFLTDAFGNRVSFRGAIIIGTSNAGAPLIKKLVEENMEAEEIRKKLIDHVVENKIFRVEFLNRFDDVIFFRILNEEQLRKVVEIKLAIFTKRLDESKNIRIKFEEGAINKIIEKGYDPVFGARSLNRYISDEIEDMVSMKLIAQQVKKGGEIKINLSDLN